jgi:hypothetical protein
MTPETNPLFFGELHAFPVLIARGILRAEFNSPWFIAGAFGRSNMSLKFDCIGTTIGYSVDIGMRCSKAAIMRLGDFRYDQTWQARTNTLISHFKYLRHF